MSLPGRLRPVGTRRHPHGRGGRVVVVDAAADDHAAIGDVVDMRRRREAVGEHDKEARRPGPGTIAPECARPGALVASRGVQRPPLDLRRQHDIRYRPACPPRGGVAGGRRRACTGGRRDACQRKREHESGAVRVSHRVLHVRRVMSVTSLWRRSRRLRDQYTGRPSSPLLEPDRITRTPIHRSLGAVMRCQGVLINAARSSYAARPVAPIAVPPRSVSWTTEIPQLQPDGFTRTPIHRSLRAAMRRHGALIDATRRITARSVAFGRMSNPD